MTAADRIGRIKSYTDQVGPYYGTEDLAVYVYSMIKMHRPQKVLELGTGLATVSLWAAAALLENGTGELVTVDDGSQYVNNSEVVSLLGDQYTADYKAFVEQQLKLHGVETVVNFVNKPLEELTFRDSYDMLFADFSHSPFAVTRLLGQFLPRITRNSTIFIHSASTYYSSYHTLEAVVNLLNQKRIPLSLREMVNPGDLNRLEQLVNNCVFELTHLVENKQRNQNSAAQIRIVPCDIVPHPRSNIRF